MTQHGLRVEDLSAERGGVEVLSGISLDVSPGETLAVLGANGAGKSTAVDAICGFARKRSGRIMFGERDITQMPPHKIAQLGLVQVAQERDLFSHMTVHENLMLGRMAARRREGSTTEDDVYESFPVLKDRSEQRAGSLSGGEQQMLAIGRALLSQPSVLLLDEPTSGLAPIIVEKVVESIVALAQRGLTLILIEQNVEVALRSASRLTVLRRGEQVFNGHRDELGDDYRKKLQEFYV